MSPAAITRHVIARMRVKPHLRQRVRRRFLVAARLPVAATALSSALGGMALACSRFVIGATDAIALGAWRYCVGFVCLLPITLAVHGRWPPRADWAAVALLGLLFFAIFPVLYNLSIAYTTAARASLALSTLPLLTMVAAAALGIERLTWRKSAGVAIAIAGVAASLAGIWVAATERWAPPSARPGCKKRAGPKPCSDLFMRPVIPG